MHPTIAHIFNGFINRKVSSKEILPFITKSQLGVLDTNNVGIQIKEDDFI